MEPARRSARRTLLAGLSLGALAAVAALRLPGRLSTDLYDLLPRGEPAVDRMRVAAQSFGAADQELVAIGWPDGGDSDAQRERAGEVVAAVAAALRARPEIASVFGDLDEAGRSAAGLGPHYFLLLPESRREEFARRTSPEGMRAALSTARELLGAPGGGAVARWLQFDPLGLYGLALDGIPPPGGTRADPAHGLLLAPSGRQALLVVRGRKPLSDLAAARATRRALDEALADGLADAGVEPAEGITAEHAGGYAIAAADEAIIRHDASTGSLLTTAFVFCLFFIAGRGWRAPVILLVPLSLASLWLVGLLGLSPVRLGAPAAGSAGMLLGLGSDLALVLYARMLAKLESGRDPASAAREAAREARGATWLCAVTTAATFGALGLTSFPALRQLGLLVALGILISAAAVLWLQPALFVLLHPPGGYPPLRNFTAGWLDRLRGGDRVSPARFLLIWAAALSLGGGFLWFSARRADFDLAAIHRRSNPEVGKFERMLDEFGLPRESRVLVSEGDSLEALARGCKTLPESALAAAGGFCRIARGAGRPPEGTAGLAARFQDALTIAGFRPAAFEDYLAFLDQLDAPAGAASAIAGAPLLREFVVEYCPGGGPCRYRAQTLFPADQALPLPAGPAAFSASVPEMNDALLRLGRRELGRAALAGIIAVGLLCGFGLRRWRPALWVMAIYPASIAVLLAPLLAGWMVFDMLAAAGLLVLAGIVTDYAVQWHAGEAGGGASDPRLHRALNAAIALDGLTTLVAFLSLLSARYAGMQSLGMVVGLSSAFGCLLALVGRPRGAR